MVNQRDVVDRLLQITGLCRGVREICHQYLTCIQCTTPDGIVVIKTQHETDLENFVLIEVEHDALFRITSRTNFSIGLVNICSHRGRVECIGDMSSMFEDAEDFNADVSQWDMSQVTNASKMFAGALNTCKILMTDLPDSPTQTCYL